MKNNGKPGIGQLIIPVIAACGIGLLESCVSMAPVASSFESAKTLGRNQIELTGNYSSYYLRSEDEYGDKRSDNVNNNWGFRMGYGLSPRFDMKFRYEHLTPVLQEDKEQLNGANYFALTPRYGIVKDHITAALDMGLYSYTLKGTGNDDPSYYQPDQPDQREHEFVLSPRIAFTYPSGKCFDMTLTTKADIFTTSGESFAAMNLGFGVSSDLETWALRPEFGFVSDFAGSTWLTTGIALVLKFNLQNKAKTQ